MCVCMCVCVGGDADVLVGGGLVKFFPFSFYHIFCQIHSHLWKTDAECLKVVNNEDRHTVKILTKTKLMH